LSEDSEHGDVDVIPEAVRGEAEIGYPGSIRDFADVPEWIPARRSQARSAGMTS
jgi:hypothetical protein